MQKKQYFEGKEPFSAITDRFAIVTEDGTKYTPDTQAINAVEAARLVAKEESHEFLGTSLQPGLQARLFTAFVLPTSVLSKRLTLVCLGDNSSVLRLPLSITNRQAESEKYVTDDGSNKEASSEDGPSAEDKTSTIDASQIAPDEESNIRSNSEPGRVLVEHFRNIVNEDYQAAYEDFGVKWKSKQSFSEFVAGAKKTNWILCNRPENCVLKENFLDSKHGTCQ